MINRFLFSAAGFFLAFFFGATIGTTFKAGKPDIARGEELEGGQRTVTNPVTSATRTLASSGVEFSGLKPNALEFPESNDLIELFETNGLYRESEVVARDGERWLTVFDRGGKYSLEFATADVKKKRTRSYPGDEYDVQLSFNRPGDPLFAVSSNLGLKPRAVTTLYHRPSHEEITRRNLPIGSMEIGYKRSFDLNGNWYMLHVAPGLDTDRNPLGVLVLENENTSQVIATNATEIVGDLFWVGDLDGDNKLDLLFDDFNEKGAFVLGLYLSSAAKPGNLVKRVAVFSTAGC